MVEICVYLSIRAYTKMFTRDQKIAITGVASDLGANMAGTRLGPQAIRIAGLHRKLKGLGYATADLGDIDAPLREYGRDGSENYLQEIIRINESLKLKTLEAIDKGFIPLTLGGDHSLSIGSVAACKERFNKLGLIWIDTHADLNNPHTSRSKNIHGMPVSTLMGDGYEQLVDIAGSALLHEHIVMIGLRHVDELEKALLKNSGITYYSMRAIDEMGIQGIIGALTEEFFPRVSGLHVSFDLDVMDPTVIPGVSTAVHGGLTLREAHLLLELLHETGKIVSGDFVELNPMRDIEGKSARIAVDLIGSMFGSSII